MVKTIQHLQCCFLFNLLNFYKRNTSGRNR